MQHHRITALLVATATTTTIQLISFHRVHQQHPTVLENWKKYDSAAPSIIASTSKTTKTSNYSVTDLEYDLSVVITSSLIPSHPRIDVINHTIYSLLKLDGLPLDVPIYITVDGNKVYRNDPNKTSSNQQRISHYIHRLRNASFFYPFTNIQVLPMTHHRHLAGCVHQALQHISKRDSSFEPKEHLIYLLQHDLYFTRLVPHTQLVQAMRKYPEDIKNVRFRFNYPSWNKTELLSDERRFPPCRGIENGTVFKRNDLSFFATSRWSDNNQLSTLQYYQDMIVHIQNSTRNGRLNLPMEWVLMRTSSDPHQCAEWGQAVLGDRTQHLGYLGHLDGSNTLDPLRRKMRTVDV